MKDSIDLQEIIRLSKEQYPDRQDLIASLQNCTGGQWTSNGYYQYVNDKNANQPHAEWQHEECIVLEQNDKGDIVIDLRKDGRIGGIEFIDLIDK